MVRQLGRQIVWAVLAVLAAGAASDVRAAEGQGVGLALMARDGHLCAPILTEEYYDLAVIKIDIGGGEIEDGAEVIVIRDREIRPEDEQPDTDQNDPRRRPELGIPQPRLEIVTPTPSRRDDEVPLPISNPKKKPTKDLPN